MKRLDSSLAVRALLVLVSASSLAGCSAVAWQQSPRPAVSTQGSAPQSAPAPSPQTSPQPSPQTSPKPNPDDAPLGRATSEPYAGDLSIFEDPERDRKLQVERVMDVLGVGEGTGVADIGAGSGWFTVRAARRAGTAGTVYAVEINPDYLKHIERRAGSEGLTNVKTVLGREDDPALPERSVDAALILKTYHEIAQPVRLLRNLRRALRPGARVGVIDREGKGDDHGVARDDVVSEAERAGYALVEEHDFVKGDGMDYLLVFRPRE
ncbi:MAG TPA: methyltransferase domain-containing protein [Pyrinomonadaceae bacterium]|nr:methyltransferase domain-containing protein [Pyrinomonadaceae bacterium]